MKILGQRAGPAATSKYFKDIGTSTEKSRAVLNSLRKKGLTEGLVNSYMEKYDKNKVGTITIDEFHSVFDSFKADVSFLDVRDLLKRWFPHALSSGKVNYEEFLKKLFCLRI